MPPRTGTSPSPLLTGIPTDGLASAQGRAPQIGVTGAATTLLDLDHHPAELTAYGAIDADTARHIAGDQTGTWRRIVTDPATGQILDYGRSTYRPPHHLTDHIVARDRTCRFPAVTPPPPAATSTTPPPGTGAAPPTPTTWPHSAAATTN